MTLEKTQSVVTKPDGVKLVNGEKTGELRSVGNLEKVGQESSGAVGPFEFLSVMSDKETKVRRWKDVSFAAADKSQVKVY